MVHIVQVVMWGVAEAPQLFLDEKQAQSAFVACVRKQWLQRYAAYCEHHGVDGGAFPSAQGFVNTIDVSEKSTINFWSMEWSPAALADAAEPGKGAGVEEMRRLGAALCGVREGIAKLLGEVTDLAERVFGEEAPAQEEFAAEPEKKGGLACAAKEAGPEPDPQRHASKEWRAFVALIRRTCSGSRNDFYLLPRDDWRGEIYSNRTSLEYWDWAAETIERYKTLALGAGYSLVEEPDEPGCYRFSDQEGSPSEGCYSEWEAWCAAGLHQESLSRSA